MVSSWGTVRGAIAAGARRSHGTLLIDLACNSSRLEGNTYALLETERLLSVGETVQGKNALEAQMITKIQQNKSITYTTHKYI